MTPMEWMAQCQADHANEPAAAMLRSLAAEHEPLPDGILDEVISSTEKMLGPRAAVNVGELSHEEFGHGILVPAAWVEEDGAL